MENEKQFAQKPLGFFSRCIIWGLILLAIWYFIDRYLLNLPRNYFWGLFIAGWIAFMAFLQLLVKFLDKRAGYGDKNNEFIFPSDVASVMKKTDMGIQYEANIISMSFLLEGMTLFGIYMVFFTDFNWFYKGFYIFNFLCAAVLMASMLITQYQQYVAYRESKDLFRDYIMSSEGTKTIDEIMKEKQNGP